MKLEVYILICVVLFWGLHRVMIKRVALRKHPVIFIGAVLTYWIISGGLFFTGWFI
jgi:hypothetical protein